MSYHFNFTFSIPKEFLPGQQITETCFNWCKEAHFAHNNNLEIELLILPAIALISLLVDPFIKDTEYEKYNFYLIRYSKYLLIVFFVMFFYRYYF